jgi:putative transposase
MATENPSWGYTRIQGALANVEHAVSRGTIAAILKQHGLDPAPERQKRTTWRAFLRAQWSVLATADFFTVEVWTGSRLTRFAVLGCARAAADLFRGDGGPGGRLPRYAGRLGIDWATRRVEIAGIVREPDGAWVVQCGRQITDPVDGILAGKRYLLHDRDPLFTDAFRATLGAAGVETVRLQPSSPNLNAYAERFVRTIKESCLGRLLLVGEDSLRRAIREFMMHYHHERNHQGMGNLLLFPCTPKHQSEMPITCLHRLGGMLKYYRRQAA